MAGTVSRRRTGLLAAAAAALLVPAGGWWLTHPPGVTPVSSRVELPGVVGEPALFGLSVHPRDGSVRLRDVRPRVHAGSAPADLRVVWCSRPAGGLIGAARGAAEQACARVSAPEGRRLAAPALDDGSGELLLQVTPRGPGTVLVDGVEVRWADGLRRGHQAAGVAVRVSTP